MMMTGLRKRVAAGFLSIVFLLFFAGMVSLFELGRLSRDTGEILDASKRHIDRAKVMLDAAHEQNVALIRLALLNDRSGDTIYRRSIEQLEAALNEALVEAPDRTMLDSLVVVMEELRQLADPFALVAGQSVRPVKQVVMTEEEQSGVQHTTDSLPRLVHVQPQPIRFSPDWYTSQYEALYSRMTTAIKSYMTSTQGSLAPRAEQLKKNAYRAVTPVLISLMVMIALVLMLYYFMSIYCVLPIVRMNKALGDFLVFRTPFAPKSEFKDEMLGVREKIETLIAMIRQAGNGKQ